jgi:hypothetical protein
MIVLVAFPNMNEILWLLERQWIEDYHFHYAEDGSGGADAERQRRDGHRCEAQASARRSQGVAQILDEAFNEVWAASVVALLFGSLDCGKLYAGLPERRRESNPRHRSQCENAVPRPSRSPCENAAGWRASRIKGGSRESWLVVHGSGLS